MNSEYIEYVIQQVTRTPSLKYIYDCDTTKNIEEQLNYFLNNNPWPEEQTQIDLFVEAMKNLDNKTPCLIELGSSGTDGSTYSILFEKFFNYKCEIINTEPRRYLLEWVKIAWKNKHLVNAKLIHGYSGTIKDICGTHEGQTVDFNAIPRYTVNEIIKKCKIEKVDILHCDIQGAEVEVLEEIIKDDMANKILYYFISLHSTHEQCSKIIKDNINAEILYEHPTQGGFGDGLIVFKNLNFEI